MDLKDAQIQFSLINTECIPKYSNTLTVNNINLIDAVFLLHTCI